MDSSRKTALFKRSVGLAWIVVALSPTGVLGDSYEWVLRNPHPTPSNLTSAVWTGAGYVAVTDDGGALISRDGRDWEWLPEATGADLFDVAWTGTDLVAVGAGGKILVSPDGIAWTAQSRLTSANLNDVIRAGDKIVAAGEYGVILTADTSSRVGVIGEKNTPAPHAALPAVRMTDIRHSILTVEAYQRCVLEATLYDVRGRTVTVVYSGEIPAGKHRLDMSGRIPAGGTYVLELHAGQRKLYSRFLSVR